LYSFKCLIDSFIHFQVIAEAMSKSVGGTFNVKDEYAVCENLPRQADTFNCGMFCIAFSKCYVGCGALGPFSDMSRFRVELFDQLRLRGSGPKLNEKATVKNVLKPIFMKTKQTENPIVSPRITRSKGKPKPVQVAKQEVQQRIKATPVRRTKWLDAMRK
jgi:hypothetical protein